MVGLDRKFVRPLSDRDICTRDGEKRNHRAGYEQI